MHAQNFYHFYLSLYTILNRENHKIIGPHQFNFFFVGHLKERKKVQAGERLNNKITIFIGKFFRRYINKFERMIIFFSLF